jgi:hypothetical protein
MASMTVELTERPDMAENLRTSGVDGDSGCTTGVGQTLRSPNFPPGVWSDASLCRRCLAIRSCNGRLLTTLVAAVGETISSSKTSPEGPSVTICSLRVGLLRTVTFLIRLSSHSHSTSLTSSVDPHSPSNTTNSSCDLSTFALGVVAPSLSDSKPSPNPTSLGFEDFCGTWGTSTADVLAEGRTGLTVGSDTSSSSEDSGCSRAVLNESVREDGYRSLPGGRNAKGIALGGVTSGVGGLF